MAGYNSPVRFTKMHGLGNDYVYVDLFAERPPGDRSALARAVSDRHTGIGADGLILIAPPENARNDARMEMYNADGSRGDMCGNGIRCVGKYLYERRGLRKDLLRVETDAGLKTLQIHTNDGAVREVSVDMGVAVWDPARIPVASDKPRFVDEEIRHPYGTVRATCVSMGNPHCVVFCEAQPADDQVRTVGPVLERHPLFPKRANVGFAHVVSPRDIVLRVWERGSGETLACGTGACAAAAAANETGRAGRNVTVRLRGGDLRIERRPDDRIIMTGPAVEVFTGDWPLPA